MRRTTTTARLHFFFTIFHFFVRINFSFSEKTMLIDVTTLGARPDGKADLAEPLAEAWSSACNSNSPKTIHVPAGRFYLSKVAFNGPCKKRITFRIDGTIVASSSYGSFTKAGHGQWVLFDNVKGVTINGGKLDGQGSALWSCKASGSVDCPDGLTNLVFNKAKDVKVNGLTSVNSKLFHIVIDGCEGVTLQRIRIVAPENSPNTDGVHVQRSEAVTISDTAIGTGDDCISVGPGTSNLWIEQVTCGPGHGISIGSLGKTAVEEGVKNVTVTRVSFRGTQNGLRIKSWGRQSSGFVNGVLFQHVSMENVHNPIIIDQNYCPHNVGCLNQDSGINITKVTYKDVHGSSATPIAVNFDCSPAKPCDGIQIQDIKLRYQNQMAKSQCKNARGTSSGYVLPPSCL